MPNTEKTFDMIYRYVDSWILLFLFVIAVGYLFYVCNKKQKPAIVAILVSACLFINDLVLYFVEEVMGEDQRYYRYLWTIPFIFFIVTCVVDAFRRWKNKISRIGIIVVSSVLLFILYRNNWLLDTLPDFDIQLMSDEVYDISNKLNELSKEKIISVACPDSLYETLVMNNGNVFFTKETIVIDIDEENHINFGAEEPNVDSIMGACCANGMDYLIIKFNGNSRKIYEEFGFTPIYETKELGLYECRGYDGIIKEYTKWKNVSQITYVDCEGKPRMNSEGYSTVIYSYNRFGKCVEEYYYDETGKLTDTNDGYASVRHEYLRDGELSLSYFYDRNGNLLELGSAYLHQYLMQLSEKNVVFISIKDDGTAALTKTILDDLKELGINTDLSGKYRYSFYAIVSKDTHIEKLSEELITYSGIVEDYDYSITSGGFYGGSYSSIVINGKEYSKNSRGINIVSINENTIESITFDTLRTAMNVTR